jgi:predicted ATPase
MLLGRSAECARIEELLSTARSGRCGVLALCGEAGVGKSTLLEYAVERAGDMRVLATRGYESESEIPFAGLADVLRPALPLLPELPAPQAAALRSALALGPPVAGDRASPARRARSRPAPAPPSPAAHAGGSSGTRVGRP